jgi:hypothetical protein
MFEVHSRIYLLILWNWSTLMYLFDYRLFLFVVVTYKALSFTEYKV